MFKSTAVPKLPTHRQYLRENGEPENQSYWDVDCVFLSSDWNTITFKCLPFRYSVKFATDEEYDLAVEHLRSNELGALIHAITYDPESQEWEYLSWRFDTQEDWELLPPAVREFPRKKWKLLDWGFVTEEVQLKKHPKAKKRKPPATPQNPSA